MLVSFWLPLPQSEKIPTEMIWLQQMNPFKQTKKDKIEGIPIMLVQALEYTACQWGTAGRSTKIGPRGCGFVWSVGDAGIFYHLQNPDSPPLLATQHLFVLPKTKCFIFLRAWFIKREYPREIGHGEGLPALLSVILQGTLQQRGSHRI